MGSAITSLPQPVRHSSHRPPLGGLILTSVINVVNTTRGFRSRALGGVSLLVCRESYRLALASPIFLSIRSEPWEVL
jgi:hypothetical protein